MTPKQFAIGFLAILAVCVLGFHAANAATMVCANHSKVSIVNDTLINGKMVTTATCSPGKAVKVRKARVAKQKTAYLAPAAVVGTTPIK